MRAETLKHIFSIVRTLEIKKEKEKSENIVDVTMLTPKTGTTSEIFVLHNNNTYV